MSKSETADGDGPTGCADDHSELGRAVAALTAGAKHPPTGPITCVICGREAEEVWIEYGTRIQASTTIRGAEERAHTGEVIYRARCCGNEMRVSTWPDRKQEAQRLP